MNGKVLLGNVEKIESIAEVLTRCERQGFSAHFIVLRNSLYVAFTNKHYLPEQLQIQDVYRYEGLTDPSDNGIIYALIAPDGTRGTVVDAYGVYANDFVSRFKK